MSSLDAALEAEAVAEIELELVADPLLEAEAIVVTEPKLVADPVMEPDFDSEPDRVVEPALELTEAN